MLKRKYFSCPQTVTFNSHRKFSIRGQILHVNMLFISLYFRNIIDSFLEVGQNRHLSTRYPWLAERLRKQNKMKVRYKKNQVPVVQSIFSLTMWIRRQPFKYITTTLSNAKDSQIFSTKNSVFVIYMFKVLTKLTIMMLISNSRPLICHFIYIGFICKNIMNLIQM